MPIKLQIRKKSGNVWEFVDVEKNKTFSSSKQFMRSTNSEVSFKEPYGNDFAVDDVSEIAVYDDSDTGAEETFATVSLLGARLRELKAPIYDYECDGDVNGGTP